MEKVELHQHTHFSKLDGMSTIEDIINSAKELNEEYVTITDHGSCAGHFQLQEEANKVGLKSIKGIEAYCNFDLTKKERKTEHLIILAKNKIGYENLLYLNWLSNQDSHFYYKPRIDYNSLVENKEGLIIGSACMLSAFGRFINNNKIEMAKKLFDWFVETFKDNFYAEIQINELDIQKNVNNYMINWANEKGIPIVLTNDTHYPNKNDSYYQFIMMLMNRKKKLYEHKIDVKNGKAFEIDTKYLYPKSIDEHIKLSKKWEYVYNEEQIKEWCSNSYYIAKKCDYEIPMFSDIYIPKIDNSINKFKQLCYEGIKRINKDKDEIYVKRLEYEIDIILNARLQEYFLIVKDYINAAKNNNVEVGLARGSSGGSLVCYCLGIIEIDPIVEDLSFERFLNPHRVGEYVINFLNGE